MQSAPLGTSRTASRIRGSGCRRRARARLLLAGDTTFEDGLGIIHYCRLGDLLRVVCDEGGIPGTQPKAYESRIANRLRSERERDGACPGPVFHETDLFAENERIYL